MQMEADDGSALGQAIADWSRDKLRVSWVNACVCVPQGVVFGTKSELGTVGSKSVEARVVGQASNYSLAWHELDRKNEDWPGFFWWNHVRQGPYRRKQF